MKGSRILPEPWRVKMVERIELLPRNERLQRLKEAHYNLFLIKARDIFIDLLTDSGTSAMSDAQWSGMMRGDESYAYARSWERFEASVREVTGFKFVLPTHQGRASEHILFGTLVKKGDIVPSNNHFDTTRANIEALGAQALDLVIPEGKDPQKIHPFKGNMDLAKLQDLLAKKREKVPFCMLTVTNNTGGGQPVAMDNIFQVSAICRKHGLPLFLDACRYAENAYFIKLREEGYGDVAVARIGREMFSYADGCTFSAKKDGLANIGGFIGLNSPEVYDSVKNTLILKEGFLTYGGLSGRDLEAVAVGLKEAQEEEYLRFRIEQVALFGERLKEQGAAILEPTGGHAVYLDALRMLPGVKQEQLPAQALAVALYLEGGVRGVEIGSVMFASTDPKTGKVKYPPMELVRLAVPRRVYTNDHLAYAAEAAGEVVRNRSRLPGYRLAWAPERLRHFTARFEPLKPLE
jgi:tyrosine phenol-lyase